MLNKIPRSTKIKLTDKPPKHAGIYIAHCHINDPRLENFLVNIWKQNNTHIHVDETYMIDKNSDAFNAILTQGRSKRISMTCLSQRPVQCSRWIVSEATNFSVFHMNDQRDKKIIESFVPVDLDEVLPEYHSHWYNAKANYYALLRPVPDSASILERFNERLKPRHRFL